MHYKRNFQLDFFATGENSCTVLDGTEGVLFVKKLDGRATGDAFVLFANESDAPKALSKHRESIGARYIELFRSTTAEVQQVRQNPRGYVQVYMQIDFNVSCRLYILGVKSFVRSENVRATRTFNCSNTQRAFIAATYHYFGDEKRLRQTEGIALRSAGGTHFRILGGSRQKYHLPRCPHGLQCSGGYSRRSISSCSYYLHHYVTFVQGQPSGEAFIQMDSEHSAFITAQNKHHRYMIFGKKQRYIEVFQCSGEDMNLVLTGGIPAPVSPAKAAPALLSPGMLPSIAPLPPTNIPPPPPPSTSVAPISQSYVQSAHHHHQLSWENPTLIAQQQAQMIAQQNLLARQSQAQVNDIMLMNQIAQHNIAVLNQNVGSLSPGTPAPQMQTQVLKPPPVPIVPHHILPQHPFLLLPPRVAPLSIPRTPVAYSQHLLQSAPPGVIPMAAVPHVAVKRSYGDAFNEQTSPAKRAFHPQSPLPVYPQFYPNM